MAQWRDFAATNEPGTCLWCGRKLRRKMVMADFNTGYMARVRGEKAETRPAYDKAGDYGDGHFCGLRCAYSFAVALADHGRRLQPKADA